MSNFLEAYVCECGHAMRKYLDGRFSGLSYFSFHSCCPECGASRDKIELKSGKWKTKSVTTGWWIFKTTTDIDDKFIESGKYL